MSGSGACWISVGLLDHVVSLVWILWVTFTRRDMV